MKQIQELIKATQVLRVEGNSDTRVSRLAYDSRRIAPGDCFFAVSGTQSDGHAYIDAAVAAGAVAVVCQRLPEHLAPSVCYVVVADTNAAMADMAAAFYGDPSRQLKLVLSRSPPQPHSTKSCCPGRRISSTVWSTFSRASGVWA